jgi:ribosomal protein S18 acetylase RimI-like enzyme
MDLSKIDIQLQFWGSGIDTPYTLRLSLGKMEVVEALGVIQGSDFRLTNITTVPVYRKKGFATTVVGTLIGVAKSRQCSTFTIEDVSPRNIEATSLYRRFGAVAMPPKEVGGHSEYQIRL